MCQRRPSLHPPPPPPRLPAVAFIMVYLFTKSWCCQTKLQILVNLCWLGFSDSFILTCTGTTMWQRIFVNHFVPRQIRELSSLQTFSSWLKSVFKLRTDFSSPLLSTQLNCVVHSYTHCCNLGFVYFCWLVYGSSVVWDQTESKF